MNFCRENNLRLPQIKICDDQKNQHQFSVSSTTVIKIEDDQRPMDKKNFPIGSFYEPYVESVMISREQIEQRTEMLARDIQQHFKNEPLTLLCVLKGSFPFCYLLYKELSTLRTFGQQQQPIFMEFIRLKSYCNTNSTGDVQVSNGGDLDQLKGRHVLIVEDIVDTGRSMEKLMPILSNQNLASIRIVTMLKKRIDHCQVKPDFVGFEIPDKFVVGFGLDYNEFFRELQHICIINEAGVKKFENLKH
uniref:Hypoxanthine phosphoribosyltransferase n=1 Tax=Romanomermis culicivorax TaxID=13658 RepID=A0A915HXF8_ROMCU